MGLPSTAQYACGVSTHPNSAEAVGEAIGQVLESLEGRVIDLLVAFVSTQHVRHAEDIAATLLALCDPRVLIGCTANGVISGGNEIEDEPGIVVWAAHLPATDLIPLHLQMVSAPDGRSIIGWPHADMSHGEDDVVRSALVLLTDPFTFPADAFLAQLNHDQPGLPVIGGLASAAASPGGNRLFLGGRQVASGAALHQEGAVGVLVRGGVEVRTVVSQGCRPIGQPYVITKVERHVVFELGGRPALERLQELTDSLTDDEREMLQHGLHLGCVVDEHQLDFARGDFLVRNVLGADESTGAIAVGDWFEVGQTVQFQVRDASSADEDLRALLGNRRADAVLLFTCNGRGRHLFGEPHHDAALVQRMVGPAPLAGLFCAGELGPIGTSNFLHGYTASVALFRAETHS